MAETKLANLINPQVMADMIAAELPKKIKMSPFAVTWARHLRRRTGKTGAGIRSSFS